MVQAEAEAGVAPVLIKEREDSIFILRMNRPEKLNSLGGGLPQAMNEARAEFRDDPELKVMIVTGSGRAFSVGADLRAQEQRYRELNAATAQALLDDQRARTIKNPIPRKPVIAAINGWCLAGGCEQAMGYDIRIIEEQALIGLPEVKRGHGAKTTTHKLYYLTYLGGGLEIEWTGDPMTAAKALSIGWVNEVVPEGKSFERSLELARKIAEMPSEYLEYHKERFFQSIGVPVSYAMALEQRFPPQSSEAYRAGLEASLQSSLPGWPAR